MSNALFYNKLRSSTTFVSDTKLKSCISPDACQIAMVLNGDQLRVVNCASTSNESFGQELVSVNLDKTSLEVSVFLSWSLSGSKLGVVWADGTIQLFSALGMTLNSWDFTKKIKCITSFHFLTETLLLFSVESGQLFTLNTVDSKLTPLLNVRQFHSKTQAVALPNKRIFLCVGWHPQNEDLNVSVWKLTDDYQSGTLLYTLLDPVSTFWSRLRSRSQKTDLCKFCISPSGESLVVFPVNSSPIFLQRREDQLGSMNFEDRVGDVVKTGFDGGFWSDSVFALLTEMKKIVFLKLEDSLGLVGSEDTVDGCQFIGFSPPGGMVYLEPRDSAKEWSLVCLKKESASQHVETLLSRKDFSKALELAELAGLPKQEIYKAMWIEKSYSSLTASELSLYFEHISDQDWIINVCLSIPMESLQDQAQIFKFGIQLLREKVKDVIGRFQYLKLLRQLEMLYVFEALHPGCYSWEAFKAFRSESPITIVKAFAQNSNISALQILLKSLAWSLLPHLLEILHCLPATLPLREASKVYPSTKLTPEAMKFASLLNPELFLPLQPYEKLLQDPALLPQLPESVQMELQQEGKMKKFEAFSDEDLVEFYLKESERIELETGDVDHAKEVLKCGVKKGIKTGLNSGILQLQIFQFWMKTGLLHWDLDSSSFWSKTTQEKIKDCLDSKENEEVMELMEDKFTSLAAELPTESKHELQNCLVSYLLNRDLLLFKAFISKESNDGLLFGITQEDSERLLLATVKSIQCLDHSIDWTVLSEILDLLLQQGSLQKPDKDLQVNPVLQEGLELLEVCQFGEMLSKYGLKLQYHQLQDLEASEGEQLVHSLLLFAVSQGQEWSSMEWDNCFSDLIRISSKIPTVDLEILKQSFFQSLLNAGQFSKAGEFIEDHLTKDTAEEIGWTVGLTLIASLTDLTSTGLTQQAIDCLSLFSWSKRAQREIRKIQGLVLLEREMKVSLLPVELDQMESKSELFQKILESSNEHYLSRESLKTLCDELEFTDDEFLESWKLLCSVALKQDDLEEAKKIVEDLKDKKLAGSWNLALKVLTANQELQVLSAGQEQELWILVLTHCDKNLQDYIHQMKSTFTGLSFDYNDFNKQEGYPSCEDFLYYCVDLDWRQELQAQQDFQNSQKSRVFDFVWKIINSLDGKDSKTSQLLSTMLESSPEQIIDHLKEIPELYEKLKPDWEALLEQDSLQDNYQQIQALLPALDSTKFCQDENYRYQKILELARYSGELLYLEQRSKTESFHVTSSWEEAWSLASEKSSEFKIDSWKLSSQFIVSVASLIDSPFQAIELVVDSIQSTLTTHESQFAEDLFNEAWDHASSPYGVAFILKLLAKLSGSGDDGFWMRYVALCVEWTEDFDLRIPVLPALTKFLSQQFKFSFSWTPVESELVSIYQTICISNLESFQSLYGILAEEDEARLQTLSLLGLCCGVKEILRLTWDNQLYSLQFWKSLFSFLLPNHLQDFMEYIIFQNSIFLLKTIETLDEEILEDLKDWNPEEELVFKLRKVILQACLEMTGETSGSGEVRERWKKELRKLRVKEASQEVEGMESVITSEDFEDNIYHLIQKLLQDHKKLPEVFKSIQRFCQTSKEEFSTMSFTNQLTRVFEVFQKDEKLDLIIHCLDCSSCNDQQLVESLQKAVWNTYLSVLKNVKDSSLVRREALDWFLKICHGECWDGRSWTVQPADLWILFSWDVCLKLNHLDKIDWLPESSLTSKESLHKMLDEVPSEKSSEIYVVLDALVSSGKILEDQLEDKWWSSYYMKHFLQDLENGDMDSVLKILCEKQTEFQILNALHGEQLFSDFEKLCQKSAISVGLLLPFLNLQKQVKQLLPSHGDEQILVVLLQSDVDIKMSWLIQQTNWLSKILETCPPHPTVAVEWSGEVNQEEKQQKEEEEDKESADGWDFDDDEEEEEIQGEEEEGSGGWSEVDELETALQNLDEQPPTTIALPKLTIKTINKEEGDFIGSCCFPVILARLVLEGFLELSSALLSEKFNFHPELHSLTGGQELLKNYFHQLTTRLIPNKAELEVSINHLWSKEAILNVVKEWKASCECALDRLVED